MKAMFLEIYIQVNVGFKLICVQANKLRLATRPNMGGAPGAQAVKHIEAHKGSRLL